MNAIKKNYSAFLLFMGVDDQYVQELMFSINDDIRTAKGFDHINVLPSSISGMGLFSSKDILIGDVVSPMRDGDNRTTAGRFTNHSGEPNSTPRFINGVLSLFANRDIKTNEEITVSYFDVINARLEKGEMV